MSSLRPFAAASLFSLIALSALGACGADSISHAFADDAPPLPMTVTHQGGTADFPENTVLAIHGALNNHADAI